MPKTRVDFYGDALQQMTYEAPMRAFLNERAQRVLAAAQANAPHGATGDYSSSFSIVFASTDRNVVRVLNSAPYAIRVEYGGSKSTKHRVLGRALDAAGGDVRVSATRGAQKSGTTRRRNSRSKKRAAG